MDYDAAQIIFLATQTGILLVTGCVVGWYTWETHKLRNEAEKTANLSTEASTFNTFTTIHRRLMSHQSRSNRYLVINHFPSILADVVSRIVGETYVAGSTPNQTVLLDRVLKTMQRNDEMARAFFATFEFSQISGEITVLTSAESVLSDFDLIAVPYRLEIKAAKVAAEEYKPILEVTAPPLLTFVAIRRKLTGDSTYRSHYVRLLRELTIDTLGVE